MQIIVLSVLSLNNASKNTGFILTLLWLTVLNKKKQYSDLPHTLSHIREGIP